MYSLDIKAMCKVMDELGITREVICAKSVKGLTAGHKYEIKRVDCQPYATNYEIEGADYDSCLFMEDMISPLMGALSEVKAGNALRLIGTLKSAQKVTLAVGSSRTVITRDELLNIPVKGVLAIGRGEGCDIKKARYESDGEMMEFSFNMSVSRMHCIVYREKEGLWRMFDVSSFGTSFILG